MIRFPREVLLDRELEARPVLCVCVETGEIPAFELSSDGFSIYDSIKRSLFQEKYRSSKDALSLLVTSD